MPVEIIETDFDPPNPWYGYLECLRDPPDCTHLLIVQDDTVACRNLAPALVKIATVEPDVPICLYLGMLPPQKTEALRAAILHKTFVDLIATSSAFLPIVAVLWPIEKARHFYAWGSDPNRLRQRNGKVFVDRSDDAMGGRWWRSTVQRVVATIPSLVEHPDDVISTIARENCGRTALFWHGEDFDALSVDWASG